MRCRLIRTGAVMLQVLIGMASASAPDQSLRPQQRTVFVVETPPVNPSNVFSQTAPLASLRPIQRSNRVKLGTAVEAKPHSRADTSQELTVTRPKKRRWRLFQKKAAKGALCGVRGIEGIRIDPVRSRTRGCGIADPVRVRSVDGVTLSQPAIMDCDTAKSLLSWVNDTVKPTIKRKGGGVKSLRVAAHYACRTRNNRKGARISEHGKGRAIDISAIRLKNGATLSVLNDWNSKNRRIMRKLHKGACGPFGTVLGPNSDRYHKDHFHFDTASYRSGPYCR